MTSTLPTSELHADARVDEPFFIVASERSGTTLLRLILDSHPDLTWCHEFSYVVSMLGDDGERPNLDEYHEYLELLRVFESSTFRIDRSLDYDALVNSFLGQRLADSGKPIVGANVHSDVYRLPLLWPNARYIHLVRDGRDVTESVVRQGWYGSYLRAAGHWRTAEEEWDQLSAQVPDANQLLVSYSELVLTPEATLTKICDFIGVDYCDDLYQYSETTDYSPLDTKHIGKWAQALSPTQIGLIESRIGPMLTERGFELSGHPIPELSARDVNKQLRIDRLGRVRARVAKYGIGLTVAEMFFRVTRVRPIWRRCRHRMNAIETSALKKSW